MFEEFTIPLYRSSPSLWRLPYRMLGSPSLCSPSHLTLLLATWASCQSSPSSSVQQVRLPGWRLFQEILMFQSSLNIGSLYFDLTRGEKHTKTDTRKIKYPPKTQIFFRSDCLCLLWSLFRLEKTWKQKRIPGGPTRWKSDHVYWRK